MQNSRLPYAIWALAYVVFLSVIVAAVIYGRRQALAVYGSDEAQDQWNEWREDASQMAKGAGPVKRRAPKSAEPPALVLMRDYFVVCLALAIILSTVLFGTFMVFVRGAMQQGETISRETHA
jgi:hypothetical protein